MTVAEFISLWNNINNTDISIKYYYKNNMILKHQLCNIQDKLSSIKITISQNKMCEDNLHIYNSKYEEFNYTQQQFYDTLRVFIPEGSFVYTLNIYIN